MISYELCVLQLWTALVLSPPGQSFFMLDEGEKGWYSGVDGEITDKRGEKNV